MNKFSEISNEIPTTLEVFFNALRFSTEEKALFDEVISRIISLDIFSILGSDQGFREYVEENGNMINPKSINEFESFFKNISSKLHNSSVLDQEIVEYFSNKFPKKLVSIFSKSIASLPAVDQQKLFQTLQN